MPTTQEFLYTRPASPSHLREVIDRIQQGFSNTTTDLTVLEGLFWQSLTNNETTAITLGQLVYGDAAGSVQLAQANDISTSEVVGMVYDSSISAGSTGRIVGQGFVEATTAQWDALTGDTGGLVAGAEYYLDPTTAGSMTRVAPSTGSGHVVAIVGKAISTTVFKLEIQLTVQLL